MADSSLNQYSLDDLLHLMARLRDPEHGCSWDLKQSPQSIVNYSIEEVYELADAIDRGSDDAIQSELGDVLFQVIFLSHLYQEQSRFAFDAVVNTLCEKLLRRHPHIFPNGDLYASPAASAVLSDDEIKQQWEAIKQREREASSANTSNAANAFDDIPLAMPAMLRAEKLQKRATQLALVDETDRVLEAHESNSTYANAVQELIESSIATGEDPLVVVGELLFASVAVAKRHGVQAEASLRAANDRFVQAVEALPSSDAPANEKK